MKLFRHGPKGSERPGCIDLDGVARDLTGIVPDIAGEVLTPEGLHALGRHDVTKLPQVPNGARMGAAIGQIGKFVCIGVNFSDHAEEANMTVPAEPIIFMKPISAVAGPFDDVELPRGSVKGDWEVELGIVIGKPGRYIEEANAMAHIAGYCVVNDLSERQLQLEGTGQWVKGKAHDGFGPIGPWLVTADEIAAPQALPMWLEVNGTRYQNGNSRTMVHKIPFIVSYVSQFMSLQSGDVIATGTPAGVGMGQKPPVFLKPGDVMRLGIDGLGEQLQRVSGYAA